MNNSNDEMNIKITENTEKLNQTIEIIYQYWLKASNLTEEELLEYANVDGFHIGETDEGYYLAYYEDGEEKQIGKGLYKTQKDEANCIFARVCSRLDRKNDYKSSFYEPLFKWAEENGKKEQKRR